MISSKTEKLIVKHLCNQASALELDALETWLLDSTNNERLFHSYIKTNYAIDFNIKKFDAEKVKHKLREAIDQEEKTRKFKRTRKIFNYSIAAIITGVLVTTIVFKDIIYNNNDIDTTTLPIVNSSGIIPGSDKAILTLDDGSNIELDEKNTIQTTQINSNGSQIVYKSTPQKASKIKYNYLTIPRGGQFYLKLSDGTAVWLNSESKLKYPIAFLEGEVRKVKLIYGEAYFDVSPSTEHNGTKFIVSNQFQDIEVIGTEFNIQAYKDETNIYTTLVEGKIAVNIGSSTQNLTPNQQSNLNLENNEVSVSKVNVKSVISWKNGFFSFRGKPLKEIAKVLSRWYDVDIIFENKNLKNIKFKGSLDKSQSIEEILSIMKSNTINNYEIMDNKTIIIN